MHYTTFVLCFRLTYNVAMKIISSQQLKDAEQATIESGVLSKAHLVANAAQATFKRLIKKLKKDSRIYVFCGNGDNGADGLATALLLSKKGYDPRVYLVKTGNSSSELRNQLTSDLRKLQTIPIYEVSDIKTFPTLKKDDLIVDALIGSGLSRAIDNKSLLGKVVNKINKSEAFVLAIDVPSGLPGEMLVEDACIKADETVVLERPRVSFLLKESADYLGDWNIDSIGLDYKYIESLESPFHYTTEEIANKLLRKIKRDDFTYKHKLGHVLIAAGSRGYSGAALLATKSALVAGCGLVTANIPEGIVTALQVYIPESMYIADRKQDHLSNIPFGKKFDAFAIGPGISTHDDVVQALDSFLGQCNLKTNLVLDADALNILSENESMLDMLPPNTVITPHHGEFKRLTGDWEDSIEMLETLQGFVITHGITVVLKGKYTAVATPDGSIHFNSSGNSGLATAGTGDVLTGIIASLIAQGLPTTEAAILGVYLHGRAADIAAKEIGVQALSASVLIDYLGKAYLSLQTD